MGTELDICIEIENHATLFYDEHGLRHVLRVRAPYEDENPRRCATWRP